MTRPCWCWSRPTPAGASEVSRETLTFARGLGRRRCTRVVVGDGPSGAASTSSAAYGVARVHHADGDAFTSYAAAAWAAAVGRRPRGRRRGRGHGRRHPRGNEVLAHVACRLGVAMAANVVAVESASPARRDPPGARRRRARGDARCRRGRGVLRGRSRLRPGRGGAGDRARRARRSTWPCADADLAARVVRTEPGEPDESGGLKSARVVVGAGRGAGGADGFADLLELTELLDGSLGVSRVVTSLGWRPHHEQVGQTGSRVSPDLYVACGISGAIQHWAGMLELEDDPGDQHRRRRADGDQGALRGDRRPARDRARDQRGDPPPGRAGGWSSVSRHSGRLSPCPDDSTCCRCAPRC